MRASPLKLTAGLVLAAITILLGWAALAPIRVASRDQIFDIPRGTHARHMAGDRSDILPQTINLTLGVKDVLVLKNNDVAPHIFGPTLVMPGQRFSLPFSQASIYSFQCTAHADGQLNIIVDPEPTAGWRRLRWRWNALMGTA